MSSATAATLPLSARRGLLHRLAWFKDHAGARRTILAIDILGVAYGFAYYGQYGQFSLTPAVLWPFVPDSPLAVAWAALALLLLECRGRRSAVVESLAFIGNVQVGLWTVYVLTRYSDSFGTFDGLTLNGVLLLAHAAMAAHALIFVHGLRADWARGARAFIPIAAAYYLVNDALDYWLPSVVYPRNAGCPGIRPITVPCASDDALLASVTLLLTLGATALLWAWVSRGPKASV